QRPAPHPTLHSFPTRRSSDLRNHRKILVVDGTAAFTGGLNLGDEYLGKHPKFGYWRDTHLKVEGPAVVSLQRLFLEDWFFATDEDRKSTRLNSSHVAISYAVF